MRSRDELLARLRSGNHPEAVIIGGGINGVGVFRDLAAQGIACLLVEKGDFSSGTSAAPSRLIHGGLRYLETGEASLVRESLTERNLLLKNASHVVRPMPCWVPLRSWMGGTLMAIPRFLGLTRKPGRKGAVAVKIGLLCYDLFGKAYRSMPNHRMISRAEARAQIPALASNIRAIGEYYDARITHPERLVAELIADSESDCPASMALPYVKAGALQGETLTLTDTQSGENFAVKPKLVINAAGAWVDGVQSELGFTGRLMGGTKGSHLVIRHAALAQQIGDRFLYYETDDHRACLIYCIGGDRLIMGTTDLRSDNPEDKDCSEDEIDYMFKVLEPILPDVKLSRSDIVFAYAGVRPLPYQDAAATGAISRDHKMISQPASGNRPFPVLTLVGGKWTTYRAFAEHVSDTVLKLFGQARKADTRAIGIGGGKDFPPAGAAREEWIASLARSTGLDAPRCADLASRYGTAATAFAKAEAASPMRYEHIAAYTPAEIALICQNERVTRLEDIVLRRTLLGFEGSVSMVGLQELAGTAAAVLGWTEATRNSEVEDCAGLLRQRHRMTID